MGWYFTQSQKKLLCKYFESKKDFTFYFRSFTIERTAYFPQFSKITVLQLQPEVFVSPEPVLPQCIMGKVAAMLSVSKVWTAKSPPERRSFPHWC